MGSFDAIAARKRATRETRTALQSSVGPNAHNSPRDLHIIARTLASAGLLDENACPAQTYNVIFAAIRHVRQTLSAAGPPGVVDTMSPGDETERAVRHAIARGRLRLSHRAVMEPRSPKGARTLIDGGMKRARARLSGAPEDAIHTSPHRRALLPVVSPETFLANRRLADALANGGHLPGLEGVIAETFASGGKQAFSDVRDFFRVLQRRAPATAADMIGQVETRLEGDALKRFRKLRRERPPSEGDFRVPPGSGVS